jgi:hypothetical protein
MELHFLIRQGWNDVFLLRPVFCFRQEERHWHNAALKGFKDKPREAFSRGIEQMHNLFEVEIPALGPKVASELATLGSVA